jgi:ornithine carbamoyltransferase
MHLISILDFEDRIGRIVERSIELKSTEHNEDLRGKSLAMIFEKKSTRTRVSFEVAMTQLGGHALFLSSEQMQIGRGETIEDTARVLSRFVDGIVYRAYSHELMKKLAENSSVPVINALDDLEHPCQIIADLVTIKEKKRELKGLKLAYVGDGNNVCNSLMLACPIVGMDISVGCPKGCEPSMLSVSEKLAKKYGTSVTIFEDPKRAVENADVIYTDVWISMGMEKGDRETIFKPYQVNRELAGYAKEDYIFMHCLPAHRGLEVTGEIIDDPKHSVVFDEAENRLHVQKTILLELLK